MSKRSLIFKISSIFCLVIDVAFAIFCIISLTSVLTKYTILSKVHFIIFLLT